MFAVQASRLVLAVARQPHQGRDNGMWQRISRALAVLGVVAILLVAASEAAQIAAGDAAAQRRFSDASLKGRYAGIFTGQLNSAGMLVPIAGTSIIVADGAGGLTGHESFTIPNMVCEATISGSYMVRRDGSGSTAIALTALSPGCSMNLTQSLTIAQNGDLVLLNSTSGSPISTQWHRQR